MATVARAHLPSFDGATAWLNSGPLGPARLRGRVVLVNFWTLTCINWLRQEPYVRTWSQVYRDDGLMVIGVHTPEFAFENDLDLVRQATAERAIDYPVAVDNDSAIWNAFSNRYWPALYFADRDGIVRHEHFGEGRYAQSERATQKLLGVERDLTPVERRGVEAEADWDHLETPETYLGHWRGTGAVSSEGIVPDEPQTYRLPQSLPINRWALDGKWTIGPERITLEEPGGTIAVRFHARDAHLVLSAGARKAIPFRVALDGRPPGASAGVDVDEDGNGILEDGRMYQLVRQHDAVRDRTLDITFVEPGAEAYAFTFG